MKTNSLLLTSGILSCLSVSTLYGQWEPDVRLSLGSDNAYTIFNHAHCIATCGDTVHTVWFDSRHGWPNTEIYYRRSRDGGATWESEVRLTDDSNYSGYPSIAVSGQNIHLAYFENYNDDSNIHYMRSTDGGTTWGPDTQLTTSILMQDFPAIEAWGSNVHIVFQDEKDGNWEVYYLRSLDGGNTWEPEVRLTDDPAWSNSSSIVAKDQDVHVVWGDDRASTAHFDLYYKYSSDNGTTWGADRRLTYSLSSGSPCLDLYGSNLYIVWEDQRDGNREIYFKRSTNNGTDWEADVRLTNDTDISQLPSMVASHSNIHIAWYDYRSSLLAEIYYKRSTDEGITWGPDTRLTYDSLRSWWPSITVGDSIIHLIWTDDRPGFYQIYYKRNPTGNVGAEENSNQLNVQYFKVMPNPFVSHATIPGHGSEQFAVYDITGKAVGLYPGNQIGLGLPAGIYFVMPENKNLPTVRVIKLR